MKKILKNTALSLLVVAALFFVAPAYGAEIAVVCSCGPTEEVTAKTIERIYLKRKTRWKGGGKIVPLNLPAKSELRRHFTETVLGLGHRELVEYWNVRHFSGINPPRVAGSEEAVKILVREVEGAIGYISMENVEPDLTVIHTFEAQPGD